MSTGDVDTGEQAAVETTTAARPAPVCVEALGVVVGVEFADETLRARFADSWRDCVVSDPDAEPDLLVGLDPDDPHTADLTAEQVLERLTQVVTVEGVGANAGARLMFHACAVADPATGATVVMVGPSGMGKTTLASTLGRRWAYVTDETAAVDEAGGLLAYPKPLSVESSGHPGKDQVAASGLGLGIATGDLAVRAVLLLERVPQRPPAGVEVEDVPTVQALALLAEHTSYLAALERPLQRIAALLSRCGGLRRVRYAEAADLEPVVAELLSAGPERGGEAS